MGARFSHVISSFAGPLVEYKLAGNEIGGISASKDKILRKDEWDVKKKERKKNPFHYHASRPEVHLRAAHKYVMTKSTKPALR